MKKKDEIGCPVGVLEDYFRSGEFESFSSREASLDVESEIASKPGWGWHGFVQLLGRRSRKHLGKLHPLLNRSMKRSHSARDSICMIPKLFSCKSIDKLDSPMMNFTLSELQTATDNFSRANLIGKGGHGEVYKGRLQNGKIVAIKRLIRGTMDDIVGDFLSEMGIVAHVNHPNVTKLIGYGVEGGMHLVLQYSPRGSLASYLYGSKEKLEWNTRYKIALGAARGLLYLHVGCQRRVIHRDIKAANILLTEDFEPMVCDFGMAKWLPEHWTHHTVPKVEGTFGYVAPEYLMHGVINEKTDVFAFGVLLLEIVTGRRALDYSRQSLVLWARPLLKKNHIRELVDPAIVNDHDARQLKFVLFAAALCIQQFSIRRPKMAQVVQILKGDLGSLRFLKKSRILFH